MQKIDTMFAAASARWRESHNIANLVTDVIQAARWSPRITIRALVRALARRATGQVDRHFFKYLPDIVLILLRFVMCHGYVPSLKNPKTFSEFVNHKKRFDRSPLLIRTSDKFAVRDYVRERCGEKYLIPLLQIVDRVEDLNLDQLPNNFILKPTHASGIVEIVIDKSLINKDELFARLNSWLKLNFYDVHREWQYKNIPPRIIAEQALLDRSNQPPPDYKVFVFHGVVRMIQVDVDRFIQHRRSLYDRNWKKLNVRYNYPPAGQQPMPSKLNEMIVIAEMLGREFSFVRIDLYEHNNRVYFGEITHTPGAGLETFSPREFDRALGEMLSTGSSIPARYYF